MSSEGMNIPTLNTLILASPISSVEQSIGRIQRQKPEEREYRPLVIDVWDRFSRFQNQGRTRMKHYKSQGYTIEHQGFTCGEAEAEADETETETKTKSKKNTSNFAYRDE
jgi:superfamily II DNA or RNA helicase